MVYVTYVVVNLSKEKQRKDDNEETLKSRLAEYHKMTEPLIEYYTKLGVVSDIDGTKDLDVLFDDIKAILKD